MYRIGIDIGGTHIAAGLVGSDGHIVRLNSDSTRSGEGPNRVAKDVAELVKGLCKASGVELLNIANIGAGLPGQLDGDGKTLLHAPNLGFKDVPMREILSNAVGREVALGNDANCAALAEYHFGAAKGSHSMVMLTLGTGVGGGVIVEGKITKGYKISALELGHTVVKAGGRLCGCGRRGCLEAYCSALSLVKQMRYAMARDKKSLLWKFCAGDISSLDGRMCCEAVIAGDASAQEVFERFVDYLAEGVTDFIYIFRPETVVIGGGLSGAGELILEPLREKTAQKLGVSCYIPKIVKAALGNDAGVAGAAML